MNIEELRNNYNFLLNYCKQLDRKCNLISQLIETNKKDNEVNNEQVPISNSNNFISIQDRIIAWKKLIQKQN